MKIGDDEFQVAQCDSVLQMREILLDHKQSTERLVIVTGLDESQLGQDLLARFVKRRLYTIQSWPTLLEMFQARFAAPALLRKKWLAEYLLDYIPAQGYPATTSGVLDEETVWRIVLCDRLGFATARPDARDLLEWAMDGQHLGLYKNAPEQVREGIGDWVAQSAGGASQLIFKCIESGYGEAAAALGLSCQVVFSQMNLPELRPNLREAAVRLERFTGDTPLERSAAVGWATAAAGLIEQMVSRGDSQRAMGLIEKSDRFLADLKIESFAWTSGYSALGYEQRVERFGQQLQKVLKLNTPSVTPELKADAEGVLSHLLANMFPEQVRRIEMARRLVQWLLDKSRSPIPARMALV